MRLFQFDTLLRLQQTQTPSKKMNLSEILLTCKRNHLQHHAFPNQRTLILPLNSNTSQQSLLLFKIYFLLEIKQLNPSRLRSARPSRIKEDSNLLIEMKKANRFKRSSRFYSNSNSNSRNRSNLLHLFDVRLNMITIWQDMKISVT